MIAAQHRVSPQGDTLICQVRSVKPQGDHSVRWAALAARRHQWCEPPFSIRFHFCYRGLCSQARGTASAALHRSQGAASGAALRRRTSCHSYFASEAVGSRMQPVNAPAPAPLPAPFLRRPTASTPQTALTCKHAPDSPADAGRAAGKRRRVGGAPGRHCRRRRPAAPAPAASPVVPAPGLPLNLPPGTPPTTLLQPPAHCPAGTSAPAHPHPQPAARPASAPPPPHPATCRQRLCRSLWSSR